MQQIPLFPLGSALFPAGVLRLRVFEIRYLDMIKKCIADKTEFGVVQLLGGGEVRTPEGKEVLADTGTMARIDDWSAPAPALLQLRCSGTTRFKLISSRQAKYGLWMGEVLPLACDPSIPVPENLQASANALGRLIADMQKEGIAAADMPVAAPYRLDESGWVADRWSELLPLSAPQKQCLLALQDPVERLQRVQSILSEHGFLR